MFAYGLTPPGVSVLVVYGDKFMQNILLFTQLIWIGMLNNVFDHQL